MLRMTAEEYKLLCMKGKAYNAQSPPHPSPDNRPPKPAKHRNVKVYVYEDGLVVSEKVEGHGKIVEKYDSTKEYRRSLDLRLLEKAGRISNLERQTILEISQTFVDKEGKKHWAITYHADFTYVEEGREIVEDVKGYSKQKKQFLCTEAFWLKWKLLQSLYPEKTFRLY